MDNPEEEETTINVKRVRVTSWEAARKLAAKHGEHMGATLSRAIDQMANLDVLPREIPPERQANQSGVSGNPVNLVDMLNATAALAAATSGKIGVVPGLRTLLESLVAKTQVEVAGPWNGFLGLAGKSAGQSSNQSGQSPRETVLLGSGRNHQTPSVMENEGMTE